jgi:stress response protein YsnF
MPQAVAALQKTQAENKTHMEEMKATVEDLKRKSEETHRSATGAAATRPATPVPSPLSDAEVDVKIRNYREELLRLLDDHRVPEVKAKPDREIWQDWSRIEEE